VNRNLKQGMDLKVDLRGLGKAELIEHIVLRNDDLKAVNTEARPDNVAPAVLAGGAIRGGVYSGRLPAASWNVLRFRISR